MIPDALLTHPRRTGRESSITMDKEAHQPWVQRYAETTIFLLNLCVIDQAEQKGPHMHLKGSSGLPNKATYRTSSRGIRIKSSRLRQANDERPSAYPLVPGSSTSVRYLERQYEARGLHFLEFIE